MIAKFDLISEMYVMNIYCDKCLIVEITGS